MIQIAEMIQKAKAEGYNEANAEAKVCQDIVLTLISRTSMNRNITVKGGVVMRSISHDARRATQDIDWILSAILYRTKRSAPLFIS